MEIQQSIMDPMPAIEMIDARPAIEFHNRHAVLIGLLLSPPIAMVGWLYIEALRWAFNAFAGVFAL